MELDDSEQAPLFGGGAIHARIARRPANIGLGLFSILTSPLTITVNIISSLFHFIFRVLRIPVPRLNILNISLPGGAPRHGRTRRGSYSDDPAVVAERWVRELEEETGALCISKARALEAHEANVSLDEPGPSNRVIQRHAAKRKTLPDFFVGGYDAALRLAQQEARVLSVVLTCEEHDDVPPFRRDVLTDPELVRVLTDNNIIVWGGDVRDRDGYQGMQALFPDSGPSKPNSPAGLKLDATTYPFVAFISLYARLGKPDALTVITRHCGPSTTFTSASALSTHIQNTVLPRVAPVLNRKRAEIRARTAERELRAEQDRAFQESQRKDYERIAKRREEERRRKEEEERAQREVAERHKRKEEHIHWRRFARRVVAPKEISGSKSAVRVGVRLPNGKLVVRKFEPTDSITGLYAFVDAQMIPAQYSPEDDPSEPPAGHCYAGDADTHDWEWGFKLAVAFPKSAIPWTKGSQMKIGDVEALKGGANLVIEMLTPMPEDDSDTASDEEEGDSD
jgi:FAS-associated factor 2